MKQKYVVLVVIGLIMILYASTIVYQNSKHKKEQEVAKKEEELAFSNKQKCASYLEDINRKISYSNKNGKALQGVSMSFTFEEVWFSQKNNSCLYSLRSDVTVDGSDKIITSYQIWDYLTGKAVPFFGSSDDYSNYLNKRNELQ